MSSPTKRMTNAHAVTPTEEVAITPLEHITRESHGSRTPTGKRGGVRMVLRKKIGSERKKNSERKSPALTP
jgi:hypothetical protein